METSIIILSHGNFGAELIKSAELICGQIENVQAVSLLKGMSIDEFYQQVKRAVSQMKRPFLLVTDIFGGTPANVALMIQRDYDAQVLCGVNLPMILEIVTKREQNELTESFLLEIVEATKLSIMKPQKIIIEELN